MENAQERLKTLILTREYPPNVYGGAGVHVEHLARELAKIANVEVRCFGSQEEPGGRDRPVAHGFAPPPGIEEVTSSMDPRHRKALIPLATDISMVGRPVDADIVHSHTWYSMMAGLWIKILHEIPLVVTTHSLEPLRSWKEEQLGRGYQLSSWIEQTAIEAADAIIAVSEATREEVLECYNIDPDKVKVIHNGIHLERFRKVDPTDVLKKYEIDPGKPYLLFVGRITRQKGILNLLHAIRHLRPGIQVVLCAGAPDTPEIGDETARQVESLKSSRSGVIWIPEMVELSNLISLYSGATCFVCPSMYEPFGIINLEAMACEIPVVASKVGGIPEVVVDGETGFLVPVSHKSRDDFEPRDPEQYAMDLAEAIHRILDDPDRSRRMGKAGRARVEALFSWESIAMKTLELYKSL